MGGCVHIPWYATGFRGDGLEEALAEVAPIALRYGATSYHVYRYREDRYRFLQVATFEDKMDWERYWGGPEMTRFRQVHSGWYQVPVLYQWADISAEGSLPRDPVTSGAPSSLETEGEGGTAQA
jgi:quinol monooxygenase YgiN